MIYALERMTDPIYWVTLGVLLFAIIGLVSTTRWVWRKLRKKL